jgi:uncharacterized protein (DUF1778 family)
MEPSERITRSRARASGIDVTAAAAATRSASTRSARAIATLSTPRTKKLTVTQQNVAALVEILEKPDVNEAELKAFMKDRPAYMYVYSLWKPTMFSWMKNKKWGLYYCYLNLCKEYRNNKFEQLTFMREVLETLQEHQPEEMFGKHPFWEELRAALTDDVKWYTDYIKASLSNEAHINRVMHKGWFWHFELLWTNARDVAQSTFDMALKVILNAPEFKTPFNDFVHFDVLLEQIFKSESSTSRHKLLTFYTSYFNALPKSTIIVVEMVVDKTPPVSDFIDTCLQNKYNELLLAFYDKFDIRRTENKIWMNACFLHLVYMMNSSRFTYNKYRIRLDSIIRHYKLNVNNIYMDVTDIMQKHLFNVMARDPLRNPGLWAGKNIPLIAFAVMNDRPEIVQWLLTLGGKLNRCAIAMEDLTTNPKMLALFRADTQATKIQKKYLQHSMHPDHPSQANRQAGWDTLVASSFKSKI